MSIIAISDNAKLRPAMDTCNQAGWKLSSNELPQNVRLSRFQGDLADLRICFVRRHYNAK
jgi:hypothetical protein